MPTYGPPDLTSPVPPCTFDPRLNTSSNTAATANRTAYARVIGAPLTITKLAIQVGTQSGNIAVAVYDNIGSGGLARPNNRLATSGSVACPATGEALVALTAPVLVIPGYWFAFACDNAVAGFLKTVITAWTSAATAFCCQQNSAYPPPAQAASLVVAASVYAMIGVE